MVGIACSYLFETPLLYPVTLLLLSLSAMFCGMLRERVRLLFGVGATVAMFAVGASIMTIDSADDKQQWSGTKGCFEAQLLETPNVGGASTRVLAYVQRIGRDSLSDARREGLVYLYFANSVDVEQLSVGEKIFFETKVEPPHNAGNPAEIDIEKMYRIKGITGTVYLPYDRWQSRGMGAVDWKMQALMLRYRVVQLYERSGIDGEALAVLSALTVGEKGELSRDTKALYSSVGASHILALSGLHLGIFYMIISPLFSTTFYRRKYMLLREAVVVAVIWLFVAVAGFTPSVIRAAILFSLMALAKVIGRDTSSMNILAFAAIVMLVYSPYYLFDLSFQLSFAAVFSIILITPRLQSLMRYDSCKSVACRYIISLVAVSLAAQIGTLPFIWCYFGTFPLYFLFTNVVVVPAAFLIMLLAVVLIVAFVEPLRVGVAWLLQNLIDGMNYLLRLIAALPGASVVLPWIDAFGGAVVAVIIALLVHSLLRRRIWSAVLSAVVASLFAAYLLLPDMFAEDERYIIFFNNRNCPVAQLVVSDERSYILSSRSSIDAGLEYACEPYWRRENIDTPLWVNEPFNDGVLNYSDGMAEFSGRRIMVLADDCWREEENMRPVDCLYLCRGFLGSIEELLTVYPASFVVMDATLYSNSRRRIARECATIGVRCIDISQTGAMRWDCCEPEITIYPAR